MSSILYGTVESSLSRGRSDTGTGLGPPSMLRNSNEASGNEENSLWADRAWLPLSLNKAGATTRDQGAELETFFQNDDRARSVESNTAAERK